MICHKWLHLWANLSILLSFNPVILSWFNSGNTRYVISGSIYEWTCQYHCLSTQWFCLDSNLATFTIMQITLETFELGFNARYFWNPEKEWHMVIAIATCLITVILCPTITSNVWLFLTENGPTLNVVCG